MKSKFNVGDVVELNSGGPTMTVLEVFDDGFVLCEWFDKNHIRHENKFLESNIDLYKPLTGFMG